MCLLEAQTLSCSKSTWGIWPPARMGLRRMMRNLQEQRGRATSTSGREKMGKSTLCQERGSRRLQCSGEELGEVGGWAQSPCTSIFLFNGLPPSPRSVRATEGNEAATGLLWALKRLRKCGGLSAFPDNAQPRKGSEMTNERLCCKMMHGLGFLPQDSGLPYSASSSLVRSARHSP